MKWIIFILLCVLLLSSLFIGIMVWAIGEQLSKLIRKIEKLQK
tara:strand:- start:267 stop:395 length:129 start_codon:yes stop_codon:yes gene_type:complete